jgi:uracil-DNA glycosylase family 4
MDGRQRRTLLRDLGVSVWVERNPQSPSIAPTRAAVPTPPPRVPEAATPAVVATPPAPVLRPATPASAAEWSALRTTVRECERCGLRAGCTQTVFGVGDERAELLVVGEAPGAEEDARGEPFVGRAGGLLDAMLVALGTPRSKAFIANVIKCRPPDNREPRPEEVAECLPHLRAQLALLRPRLILCVGRIAAHALLAVDTPVGKLRGTVHDFGGTPLIVTYHPAYLLRTPSDKRKAWEDLKLARRVQRGEV